MESLRWLGLHWDEGPDVGGPAGPYQQSERVELYRRHAEDLVARGKAYYCFCPPERLEELRRSGYGYDGHCRELPAEVCREYLEEGKKAVIRFKIPQEGKITVRDYLRGEWSLTCRPWMILSSSNRTGFPLTTWRWSLTST